MVKFIFTKTAQKSFQKLPQIVGSRIIKKLQDLKNHEDIFSVLKRLHSFHPASHRLRIGEYRIILHFKDQQNEAISFLILDIGHRKDVYN